MKTNCTNKALITLIIIASFLCLTPIIAFSSIPQTLNYQGYLTDPQGTPIDEIVTVTFSIYPDSTDMSPLWTETQTVSVTNGIFSVNLGNVMPLSLPFDTAYYLGVTVGSDSEMTPRQPLSSSPYAFRAATAETVVDNAVTTTIIANDAVTTDKIANDAISTDKISPAAITSVNIANGAIGSSHIADASIDSEHLADNSVTTFKIKPNIISSIDHVAVDGGDIDLIAGANISIQSDDIADTITISATNLGDTAWTESGSNVYRNSGNVGIGTSSPKAKLSFGTDLFTPRKIALWDGINDFYGFGIDFGRLTFFTNDTEKMTILDNGNVGIGTSLPSSRLTVEGRTNDHALIAINQQGATMWTGLRLDRTGIEKWFIGMSPQNNDLFFRRSAGSDDMIIKESGNVGIGTWSPDQKLTVISTGTSDFPSNPPVAAVHGMALGAGSGSEGYDNFGGYFEAEGELGTGVYSKGETGIEASGNSRGIYVTASESIGMGIYASGDTGISAHGSSAGIFTEARVASGKAIWAKGSYGAMAGYFEGNVEIQGNLTKSSGNFKIDHPLNPENKYLSHSFVESPDMMNVYNGNVILDKKGRAWVELPGWFEALNRDFRYQLTCIGGFAPVYIAEKITDNRFKIAGGIPEMEVSWQVTGTRQDPYAKAHPIKVEEEKAPEDQGHYLHPEVYGQDQEKGIGWTGSPEEIKKIKGQG